MNYKRVIPAILGLTIYLILFYPLNWLITQKLMLIPKIPKLVNTIILILFIIFFSFLNIDKIWENKKKKKYFIVLIVFLAISSLILNHFYKKERNKFLSSPKIYSLSKNWGIQGEEITIKGIIFMAEGKVGEVYIDEQKALIKDWNNDMVKIKLPVPKKQKQTELYIKRADGKESNKEEFIFPDPNELVTIKGKFYKSSILKWLKEKIY